MTPTPCEAAVVSRVSTSRSRAAGTAWRWGMNTSQGNSVRTRRTPNADIARSSVATRSASNSCHRYGPVAADQYVVPASTRARAASVDEEIDAPRHGEHLSRDVTRFRRAEEHDCVGDVLRLARAAQRRAQDHAVVHLRIAHLPCLGGDDPGRHDIGSDPVTGAF